MLVLLNIPTLQSQHARLKKREEKMEKWQLLIFLGYTVVQAENLGTGLVFDMREMEQG
jgi:hypothetical protein